MNVRSTLLLTLIIFISSISFLSLTAFQVPRGVTATDDEGTITVTSNTTIIITATSETTMTFIVIPTTETSVTSTTFTSVSTVTSLSTTVSPTTFTVTQSVPTTTTSTSTIASTTITQSTTTVATIYRTTTLSTSTQTLTETATATATTTLREVATAWERTTVTERSTTTLTTEGPSSLPLSNEGLLIVGLSILAVSVLVIKRRKKPAVPTQVPTAPPQPAPTLERSGIQKRCGNCNAVLLPDAQHCIECGAKQKTATTTTFDLPQLADISEEVATKTAEIIERKRQELGLK